jgi:hypothetical protein
LDPACSHDFGFADLLTADPDGASSDLMKSNWGAFVSLRMRSQGNQRRTYGSESLDITVERIQVNKKGRGVDVLYAHA